MTTNHIERCRVGVTLKCIRELRGLTQDQLATAAFMSRSQLANLEAGRKAVSKLALSRLANALGVPSMAIAHHPMADTESEPTAVA